MSARAATPTVWPLAEATIRHRAGSDDQGDGSIGRFLTRPWVLLRALATPARKGDTMSTSVLPDWERPENHGSSGESAETCHGENAPDPEIGIPAADSDDPLDVVAEGMGDDNETFEPLQSTTDS